MTINDLIPHEVTETIARVGLNKIAAAMSGLETLDMPRAVGIIGARSYLRRKEARSIADGIAAYASLTSGLSGPLVNGLTKIVKGR